MYTKFHQERRTLGFLSQKCGKAIAVGTFWAEIRRVLKILHNFFKHSLHSIEQEKRTYEVFKNI